MWGFEEGHRVRASVVWVLFVIGSGCSLRISARGESARDSDGEWRYAQADLIGLEPSVDGDPFDVGMGAFRIEIEREPFYCGDTGLNAVLRVYGCFRAEPVEKSLGVIRYVPGKGALRHEARHAILFALGDTRWADVGH